MALALNGLQSTTNGRLLLLKTNNSGKVETSLTQQVCMIMLFLASKPMQCESMYPTLLVHLLTAQDTADLPYLIRMQLTTVSILFNCGHEVCPVSYPVQEISGYFEQLLYLL